MNVVKLGPCNTMVGNKAVRFVDDKIIDEGADMPMGNPNEESLGKNLIGQRRKLKLMIVSQVLKKGRRRKMS